MKLGADGEDIGIWFSENYTGGHLFEDGLPWFALDSFYISPSISILFLDLEPAPATLEHMVACLCISRYSRLPAIVIPPLSSSLLPFLLVAS